MWSLNKVTNALHDVIKMDLKDEEKVTITQCILDMSEISRNDLLSILEKELAERKDLVQAEINYWYARFAIGDISEEIRDMHLTHIKNREKSNE